MELCTGLVVRPDRRAEIFLKIFGGIGAEKPLLWVNVEAQVLAMNSIEEAIFHAASELTDPLSRAAFLERACGADGPLRERLKALLEADLKANQFLARDPLDLSDIVENQPLRASAPPHESLGTVIGRYKLLQKIGEGGCGLVYVAEQEQPVRRRVALKVIKLGMDTRQVIARFEAERQALALMDHPNIAKVLDAGETESGRPYFVMELVKGIPITRYCDENQMNTQGRLNLFIQVCNAIQHAHQKGIIHRDLKPSNILVANHDGVPVPKVIDFGIAKATTDQRLTDKTLYTAIEQFIGTPAYMSPEQANLSGLDVDTRSDIYSLGVLLYELLTGRTPFDAQELVKGGLDAVRRTIREVEPPRPSRRLSTLKAETLTLTSKQHGTESVQLLKLVRGDLDWIVMKCLEKDRARRYETANGLAADLKRHLENEPVVARPPSASYKLQKAFRRNKLVFSAAAAVVLALVAGLTLAAIGWRQTRMERDKALQARAEADVQRKAALASAVAAQEQRQRADQERQRAEADERSAQQQLYVAKMNLAQQAWDQNNLGRLEKLLEETANNPTRGFEWYYWQRQTHLDLITLRGHRAGVSSVAFSPDGKRIVTGSYDRTAKVWDAASGNLLLTLTGHRVGIYSVAFSPDSQRIVTGSYDNTAKVWDAASGTNLLTIKESGGIKCVALSPDGQRIVTACSDRMANVWDAATGNKLLPLIGHGDDVTAVAFSPDGKRIATGSEDKTVKVWDAATGAPLFTLNASSVFTSVAFSPDGQRIVTGGGDFTAKVWDADSGTKLLTLKDSGATWSVAFSPDGRRIVTGSHDQTAKVWDAASGMLLLTLKGHCGAVTSVAFSPDGKRIVTGSDDGTAKVWAADRSQELLTLKAHSDPIWSAAFSPDGKQIVTGSFDQTARVWDAASGKALMTVKDTARIMSAAFSPDGQRIATSGFGSSTATVWDAATGAQLFTLKGHSDWIRAVAFSPDGQRIVTASSDRTAKVWDAASGTNLLTLKGHSAWVRGVAFSPDSRRIVTTCFDGTAKVWDAATGKILHTWKWHASPIESVAFSRDGRRIVSASDDRTAKVWDAASGKLLLTLTGHGGIVTSADFSPDGQRIVTGSFDSTAKVWDAAGGNELLTLYGSSVAIDAVAFSPDGQRIVTGGYDGTVEVWEAATGQQVAGWQREEEGDIERLPVLGVGAGYDLVTEHERALAAQAPGAVKQWLVLAPIAFEGRTEMAALKALDQEQLAQEAHLRVRAGDRSTVGTRELVWSAAQSEDSLIDFNDLLGKVTEWSVAYAICYIQSETNQNGLLMKVGSDDQAKIYLNGREIYRHDSPRECVPDQDVVEGVELKAGLNVLVFKVVNQEHGWQGSVRFTDPAGQPVKGIRVTLTLP
jgi:eukaryotic-like serine/threonine-protein kinase